MKLKPTAVTLFTLAIILLLVLGVLFYVPIPRTVHVNEGGATGQITTVRGYMPTPGTCTTVRWNVEGIGGIWINGEGTVGASERDVCFYPDTPTVFKIAFTDNSELEYRAPATILVNAPFVWGLTLVTVALLISALAVQFAPQGQSPRILRQLAGAVMTMLISVIVTLLLLEGGVRLYFSITGTDRDKLVYMGNPADILAANSTTIPIPFINYGGVPGQKGMNQRGFRNPDLENPKPEGVYRILVLGGSTTYGHDVTAEEAYPAQMQDALRDEYGYINVEVINGGFPTYTTLNSLINFETRGLELEPDLVVVYHAYNDMIRRWQQPGCYAGENPLRGFGGDPGTWHNDVANLSPSALVRFVQLSFGLIPDPLSFDARLLPTDLCDTTQTIRNHVDRLNANSPIYFTRNLRSIVAIARGNGIEVLFTTQLANDQLIADNIASDDPLGQWQAMQIGQAEHNQLIRDVAGDMDVLLYDFAADIEYDLDIWLDNIHMNVEGLHMQGERFAAFIHEHGLIPVE